MYFKTSPSLEARDRIKKGWEGEWQKYGDKKTHRERRFIKEKWRLLLFENSLTESKNQNKHHNGINSDSVQTELKSSITQV